MNTIFCQLPNRFYKQSVCSAVFSLQLIFLAKFNLGTCYVQGYPHEILIHGFSIIYSPLGT
jgi:hypothetical protein